MVTIIKLQKWHPDNFATNESEKKIAEKKFIDIAAAKEVLTDPEKRAQFDNGEDLSLDLRDHIADHFNSICRRGSSRSRRKIQRFQTRQPIPALPAPRVAVPVQISLFLINQLTNFVSCPRTLCR